MRYFIFSLILSLASFASVPSHAVIAITNLSPEPQQFLISDNYEMKDMITVAPNATWRSISPRLSIQPLYNGTKGTKMQARHLETYVMWPDGSFGIQRYNRRGGNR